MKNRDSFMPNMVNMYGNSLGMDKPTVAVNIAAPIDIVDIIDNRIRAKYKKGFINKTRSKPITEVVIHGTAGGTTAAGLLNWMYNGGRAKEYNRGVALFHYLIGCGKKGEKKGLLVEVLDPKYYVYHSTSGRNDKQTIGIELLNPSKGNRQPYTPAQYASLFKLIFEHLMVLYPAINRITSHRYNIWRWCSKKTAAKRDKNCPGNFDWNKLDAELRRRGYAFQTNGNLRYNIK